MNGFLLVAIGGGAGAAMRHALNLGLARLSTELPFATLAANVAGSLAMGVLAAWMLRSGTEAPRLLLATGLLGGFTTFSSFSLEAVTLWERGMAGWAIGYVFASVTLALVGLAAGLALGRSMF